jgi:hypothetical protein
MYTSMHMQQYTSVYAPVQHTLVCICSSIRLYTRLYSIHQYAYAAVYVCMRACTAYTSMHMQQYTSVYAPSPPHMRKDCGKDRHPPHMRRTVVRTDVLSYEEDCGKDRRLLTHMQQSPCTGRLYAVLRRGACFTCYTAVQKYACTTVYVCHSRYVCPYRSPPAPSPLSRRRFD